MRSCNRGVAHNAPLFVDSPRKLLGEGWHFCSAHKTCVRCQEVTEDVRRAFAFRREGGLQLLESPMLDLPVGGFAVIGGAQGFESRALTLFLDGGKGLLKVL